MWCIFTSGCPKQSACVNVTFTQAAILRQLHVKMQNHRRLSYPTVCDFLGIDTPYFSPSSTVSRSNLPLEAILEVQILQNIRGEVLILISWKEVAKKG